MVLDSTFTRTQRSRCVILTEVSNMRNFCKKAISQNNFIMYACNFTKNTKITYKLFQYDVFTKKKSTLHLFDGKKLFDSQCGKMKNLLSL